MFAKRKQINKPASPLIGYETGFFKIFVQEMVAYEITLFYYSSQGKVEIDFVFKHGSDISILAVTIASACKSILG